jgi:hypothetical protein
MRPWNQPTAFSSTKADGVPDQRLVLHNLEDCLRCGAGPQSPRSQSRTKIGALHSGRGVSRYAAVQKFVIGCGAARARRHPRRLAEPISSITPAQYFAIGNTIERRRRPGKACADLFPNQTPNHPQITSSVTA